jgi:tRNA threonylcarbamoyladenosine biosynthesis protein TsaE
LDILSLRETELMNVSDAILNNHSFSKIILLKGDLGSGKTTLAKLLIKQSGVHEVVTSPTFNIVSEYHSESGELIYHFDLYRIKSIDELFEIGFEEYIDSGNRCIIEWPEIAESLFQTDRTEVSISIADHSRKYEIRLLSTSI